MTLPPNNWHERVRRAGLDPGHRTGSGTCTCSTPASPTSTGTTREVREEFDWTSCGSGWTGAWTGSGSTWRTAWSRQAGLPDWRTAQPGGNEPSGAGRCGTRTACTRSSGAWRAVARRLPGRPDPGRRGVGVAGRAAGPLRPAGRDAPGVQLRVPAGRRGGPADQRAVITRRWRRPARSARRPPGCCPITTSSGTPPGSACPGAQCRPHGIGPDDPQPDAELGLRRARAATLLMLALPGSAYLYQGEELGLPEHTSLPDERPAGPDVDAVRAHRARPGRLPGADPVGGRRARRTASAPVRTELAAAAGGLGRVRAGPAAGRARLDLRAVPGGAGPAPRAAAWVRRAGLGRPRRRTWSPSATAPTLVLANLGPTPVALPAGADRAPVQRPPAGRHRPHPTPPSGPPKSGNLGRTARSRPRVSSKIQR